ncbi:MAG: hypothetical protein IPK07_09425 [Deltaproteobacteria bacterium]|nr:hypothetical protein [Deltaproteobacteria bacterium]
MSAEPATAARSLARRAVLGLWHSSSTWVLIASAFACLLTASYTLRMLVTERARIVESFQRQLAAAADDRCLAIDEWLENQLSDAELAARSPAIRSAVTAASSAPRDALRALLATVPGANLDRTARLYDRDGSGSARATTRTTARPRRRASRSWP